MDPRGSGGHGGPGRGPVAAAGPPPIPEYFQGDKLRPQLLDEDAETWGKQLAQKLAHTQLRRFFADVVSLRRKVEMLEAGRPGEQAQQLFEEVLPEFKMLRAKAYYAHKRSESIFPLEMKQFVEGHVKRVKTWREFQAFCRHLEAVVAFHRAHRPKND